MNDEVEILRYVSLESFDAYMWQTLETKQRFISQLYAGSKDVRSMNDLDNTTINFGELKAIATGNKEIMEKFEIDNKVQELKTKERNYRNQKYILDDKLKKFFPQQIERLNIFVENCKKDIEIRDNKAIQNNIFEINGKQYTEAKEAGNAILNSMDREEIYGEKYKIGTYKGFTLYLENNFKGDKIHLVNNGDYTIRLSLVPSLNIQRINEELESFEQKIEESEKKIQRHKREIEQCKNEIQKPFEDEEKLQELLKRQSELNNKLNLDKEPILIEDSASPEENIKDNEIEEMEEY